MNENNLDYVPTRERNVEERMKGGASAKDGVAGRTEVQKRGASYRTYIDSDGKPDPMKKWGGML